MSPPSFLSLVSPQSAAAPLTECVYGRKRAPRYTRDPWTSRACRARSPVTFFIWCLPAHTWPSIDGAAVTKPPPCKETRAPRRPPVDPRTRSHGPDRPNVQTHSTEVWTGLSPRYKKETSIRTYGRCGTGAGSSASLTRRTNPTRVGSETGSSPPSSRRPSSTRPRRRTT